MQHGRLSDWDDQKGFGFIKPTMGGERIFAHISSFPSGRRRPVVGEAVTYVVGRDSSHRIRAIKVHYQVKQKTKISYTSVAAFIACVCFFTGLVVAPAWLGTHQQSSVVLVAAYALLSLITFTFYGQDKSAAKKGTWRTPESTLHFLELVGGWPGALIAQRVFRHKTRKASYRFMFWCLVATNCGSLIWLLTADGAAEWRLHLAVASEQLFQLGAAAWTGLQANPLFH